MSFVFLTASLVGFLLFRCAAITRHCRLWLETVTLGMSGFCYPVRRHREGTGEQVERVMHDRTTAVSRSTVCSAPQRFLQSLYH